METRLSSTTKEVIIGGGRPTVLIGERINPTGKVKLSQSLKSGSIDLVLREAEGQVRDGADILDVNVGAAGVDEVEMLPRVVKSLMEVVDVPLCIDSSNPVAIAAALSVYRGKALINSVSGEEKSLSSVLPLARDYGAAVIGLAMDENGIPGDPEQRLAIACKIYERAVSAGINPEDVIIDCLLLSVGADKNEGLRTLETIRRVKEKLRVNITLGASNISFGLPDRDRINGAFLAAAIAGGLTCPIVDVARMRSTILAVDLVLGRDSYALRYINHYRSMK